MTDYTNLRDEAEGVVEFHDMYVKVAATTVVAILDELEALRAAAPKVKAKSKKPEYPPEFIAAMGAMERVGIKWLAGATLPSAFKAWSARIVDGATPAEMLAGADKYARFCKATDRRVMMAQTFFGPQELFSADWTITKADARKGQLHGSFSKQDYSAGVKPDGSF